MSLDHLTDEDVQELISGRINPEARQRAIRHLLGNCALCQQRLAAFKACIFEEVEAEEVGEVSSHIYDEALDRAFTLALEREAPRWAQERAQLDRLLAAAERSPGGILELPPEAEEDFRGWPRVEGLLRASFQARFRDLKQMRLLAITATVAARNLDPAKYSPTMIADLQAQAQGELGNAFRLNHEFENAEEAFSRASALLEEGSGDLMILARLLDLQASLRSSQRRIGDALELLDHAHQLYSQVGEDHLAGRALIAKGINTSYDGRPEEAAQFLREGIALLDPNRDPQLAAIARYELVLSLLDCGDYKKAGQALLESGLREAFASDPLNLLKLRWLEARLAMALGKLPKAERILMQVREDFLSQGQDYDAALAGLDLAHIWLQRGRVFEVRDLAEEILETFQDLGVQREACDRQQATPGLAQRISGFLRRLEWEPQLRFAP